MKKVFNVKEMFKKLNKKNDTGFSLLELVVAIGILLVLTVGGLIGYSAISNNAKQAAVEGAASDVVKAIAIKESSSSFTASNISFQTNVTNVGIYKVPQDAADEWMATAGNKDIIVTASENSDLLTVKAVYDNNEKISATKTATMSSIRSGSNGDTNNGSEDSNELILTPISQGTCHPVLFAYLKADYDHKKYHSDPRSKLLSTLKNKDKLTADQSKEFDEREAISQKNGEAVNSTSKALENSSEAYADLIKRAPRLKTEEGQEVDNNRYTLGQPYLDETEKINSSNEFENPDKVNNIYVQLMNYEADYINLICE